MAEYTHLWIFVLTLSFSTNNCHCQNPSEFTASNAVSPNLTILVEQGALEGRQIESAAGGFIYSFQGIPYAKPPLGSLRFKDAEPPNSWHGVRGAFNEGSRCPQPGDPVRGSEDCLFLNVYTPVLPAISNSSLPVIVWIHGGGFVFGSGNKNYYGPDYLVSEGVILVTVNYRLGVFGFLYLEEAAPGNVGLKDQVAALRWVQRNIAAFGGDPGKVTIFGQSAGGASVHLQMLSPMSRGLFRAAIAQSGNGLNPWAIQTAPAETTRRLARAVNCSVGNNSAIVECLRGVDMGTLVSAAFTQAATDENRDRILVYTFVPTVDLPVQGVETFLPAPPIQLINEGRHHPVPFLTGFTNNESLLHVEFVNFFNETIAQKIDSHWNTTILPELRFRPNAERLHEAFQCLRNFFMDGQPLNNASTPGFMNMLSDVSFDEGIYHTLRYMALFNTTSLFVYSFIIDDSLNAGKVEGNVTNLLGASHGDDLGYLFRMSFLPEVNQNSTASLARARMVRLWTNFAKYRSPTPRQDQLLQVNWKSFGADKHFLEIGSELRTGTDPNSRRVQFWKNFYEIFS